MSEQLLPESLPTLLRDIDRRLRNLESTARVGLSETRFVRQFNSAYATTFSAWETGPGITDYVDDQGATGAGYGTLTLTLPSRALIFLGATINGIGLNVAVPWRSAFCQVGVGIDGANPTVWTPTYPIMYRRLFTGAPEETEFPFSFFVTRRDFVPGTHTLKIWAYWDDTNPASPDLPRMVDAFLLVIPLNS